MSSTSTTTVAKKILQYAFDCAQVDYQKDFAYQKRYANIDSVHKRLQGLLPRQCSKCYAWMPKVKRADRHTECGMGTNRIYEFPRFNNDYICLVCGIVEPSRTQIIHHYIEKHHKNDLKYVGLKKTILRRFANDVTRFVGVI